MEGVKDDRLILRFLVLGFHERCVGGAADDCVADAEPLVQRKADVPIGMRTVVVEPGNILVYTQKHDGLFEKFWWELRFCGLRD